MSATDTGGNAAYTVETSYQENRVDDQGRVTGGWVFNVSWKATGTTLEVFVPGDLPTLSEVDDAIRKVGEAATAYHELGS